MNARTLAQLQQAWGEAPCDHPRVEPVGHSGLEGCGQCGRPITRDPSGRPIPGGARPGPHDPPTPTHGGVP